MRMSGNKKFGRVRSDVLTYALIVPARIAANMRYPHINSLTIKTLMKRIALAQGVTVDISIDSTKGLEGFELVGELGSSDVSGVPDFVALLEVLEDLFVEIAVCVGE